MNLRNNYFFALKLILVCVVTPQAVRAAEVLTGAIGEAQYEIKLPSASNGRLLLLAHGYRPVDAALTAGFGSSHSLFDDLVEQGWTVASSSYRRNGWILEDAAEDLILLRDYIVRELAQPETVYLTGNSMGGGIVTWIAEHAPEGFDGALAMGAYLFGPIESDTDRSTELGEHFSGEPKFPILYLTNTSELEGPEAYLALAKDAATVPVLWSVERAGHVNLNYAEQAAGLQGLVDWVERDAPMANRDATVRKQPESTATLKDGTAVGTVHALVPVYGNVITSFVRSDIDALEISQGDSFYFSAEGQTVPVLLGSDYGDVAVGDWVAFWSANGYLLICRNYRDAVGSLGLTMDSVLTLSVTAQP